MKKIIKITTLFLVVIFMQSCQNDSVSITGSLEESTENGKILLARGGKTISEVSLDEGDRFTFNFDALEKGYYELNRKLIYLAPGFDLNIHFEESDVTYTGEGSLENTLLRKMLLKERSYGPKSPSTQKNKGLSIDEFKVYLSEFSNWAEKEFQSNKGLDQDFLENEKNRVKILTSTTLLMHTFGKKLSNEELAKITADANANFSWNDETLYTSKSIGYVNMLEGRMQRGAYGSIDFSKPGIGPHTISVALRDLVLDSIKNPIMRGDFLTSTTDVIIKMAPKYADDAYNVFVNSNPTKRQKDMITDSYNKMVKLRKGSPSPKFVNYQKTNGDLVSLDDLKGKYVYIDVWATWCGPCKKEIPFLKELEKKYHAKNIHFVSISVDTKNARKKWKKMVKDMNLTGIQIIADNAFRSEFIASYNIAGIPRFILLDPKGNIVEANAPRPSEKKLITLFDELNI